MVAESSRMETIGSSTGTMSGEGWAFFANAELSRPGGAICG